METIVPLDWHRMFFGDSPPLIYVEILVRIAIIWIWTMVLLRWIGGRSISQLSLVEFLLVIALGSAVGDGLFYPDVPLLQAMLVIFAVIAIDKLLDQSIRHIRKAKQVIDGQPIEVLRDGVIQCSAAGIRQIGSLELMELLRLKGAENLGSLSHAYMEPSGQISLFGADPPRPGLPIVPPVELLSRAEELAGGGPRCCAGCGQLEPSAEQCPNCGEAHWMAARAAPRFDR